MLSTLPEQMRISLPSVACGRLTLAALLPANIQKHEKVERNNPEGRSASLWGASVVLRVSIYTSGKALEVSRGYPREVHTAGLVTQNR